MQLGDDRRVDAGELGVIHEEPGFPRPPDGRSLDSRFLGVRRGEACVQRHAVGSHKGLGEVVLLQALQRCRPDDGLCLGPEQPAGQTHPAAFLGQQAGVGHAVGHIAGVQGRAAQRPCQSQRAGACIQIDEIFRQDQFCRRLGDALLLADGQLFLGGHGRLIGAEGAVRQGGPAVHLV